MFFKSIRGAVARTRRKRISGGRGGRGRGLLRDLPRALRWDHQARCGVAGWTIGFQFPYFWFLEEFYSLLDYTYIYIIFFPGVLTKWK